MADNNETKKKEKKDKTKLHVENRKARHEYTILEKYEAGIVLVGTEIKSIRNGHVGIGEAYCYIDNDEVVVKGMRIDPLQDAAVNHDPQRIRKLLLKRQEINKLAAKLIKGTTLIVTRLYLNDRGMCKVEIAIGKGKKLYDKREDKKTKDAQREMDRAKANN